MPDTSLGPSMWYAHGLYNTVVFLFFVWQGWLGSKIRMERLTNSRPPMNSVRKHRKFGPVITLLGIAGFLSGMIMVYVSGGYMVARPLHLSVGSVLTLVIIATFLISRKIKAQKSPFRSLHTAAGTLTICLYIVQIYIGMKILF